MGTSENLRRWVEAGLLDHETVEAIEAFESQPSQRASIGRGNSWGWKWLDSF